MGWKQRIAAFPCDYNEIQAPFEKLFILLGCPPGMALFNRRDRKNDIYLLTPEAAEHSAALGGKWVDAGDPTEHGWSLAVGHQAAPERFGLRMPHEVPRKRTKR